MSRDAFLLRIDPRLLDAVRQWSDDELRSVNAQIEFLLRQALRDAGRLPTKEDSTEVPSQRAKRPPPKK